MGDPADGDELTAGVAAVGDSVGDSVGVGELPVGVGERLGVCDGLGDWVGLGEVVWVGLDAGADGEGVLAGWLVPVGASVGTGRTSR